MRKVVSLLITVVMLLSITACSADEVAFYDAFSKLIDADSFESNGKLDFEVRAKIPSEEIERSAPFYTPSLLSMLSDFSIEYSSSASVKRESMRSRADFTVSAPDQHFTFTLYSTSDDDKLSFACNIPTQLMALLPQGYENARYVTASADDYIGMLISSLMIDVSGADRSDLYSKSKQIAKDTYSLLKLLAKKVEVDDCISVESGVYRIYLTDQSFKKLISEIVNVYYNDDSFKQEFVSYLDSLNEFYADVYGDEYAQMIGQSFEQILPENGEGYEEVSENLKKLDGLRLIGEDGLTIEIEIDNGGFVKSHKSYGTLVFDINGIAELSTGEPVSDEEYVFEIDFSDEQFVTRVNENIEIDIPEFDGDNSISVNDWVSAYGAKANTITEYEYVPQSSQSDLVTADETGRVFYFGTPLEMNSAPLMRNGVLYVPADDFFDSLGMYHSWGDGKYAVYNNTGNFNFVMMPGSCNIFVDDFTVVMKNEAFAENDILYIPLRAVASSVLGMSVNWNDNNKCVYLSNF